MKSQYKKRETELNDGLLRISMQFFADGGEGSDGGESSGADNGSSNGNADGKNEGSNGSAGSDGDKSAENIEKLIQARADKLTAEMGKKNAALQKELEKLKKEKMTDDELKQFEISEKETKLAEREKMLLEKENRLLAIKAIKAAGLDDGSDKALELVDFVMGENEEAISNKVKAFGELVKKFVAAEVDKTFKKNGRNPNSGSSGEGEGEKKSEIAERLGKVRADKQKQSNEVLKYYTGR